MGPPQHVWVQAGLRNLGPIALMKARDESPTRIVVTPWDVSATWPRDLNIARADQVVIVEECGSLLGSLASSRLPRAISATTASRGRSGSKAA